MILFQFLTTIILFSTFLSFWYLRWGEDIHMAMLVRETEIILGISYYRTVNNAKNWKLTESFQELEVKESESYYNTRNQEVQRSHFLPVFLETHHTRVGVLSKIPSVLWIFLNADCHVCTITVLCRIEEAHFCWNIFNNAKINRISHFIDVSSFSKRLRIMHQYRWHHLIYVYIYT